MPGSHKRAKENPWNQRSQGSAAGADRARTSERQTLTSVRTLTINP